MLKQPISKRWSRREILVEVVQPVHDSDVALARAQLSVPTSTVRRARLYGNSNKKVGKPAIGGIEEVLTVEFFNDHTFVRSGAKTATRRMA